MAGFEIVNKDEKNGMNNIFQPVAVTLLLLAVFATFESVFKFDISDFGVPVIIILASVGSYYLQVICKKIKQFVTAILGIIVFVIFFVYILGVDVQTMFIQGITPFYNSFVDSYNLYYGDQLLSMPEYIGTTHPLLIMFLLMFVLGTILSYIIRKKRGILVVLILAIVPIIVDSLVGFLPGALSSWFMLASFVLFLQCYRNKDNTLTIKEFIATGIGLFSILIVGALMLPVMKEYVKENETKYMKIREEIMKLQSADFITVIETENNANFAEGGLGEGDLSNVSRFMPSGKKKLEVTLSEKPEEDVYVKAYVGSVYENRSWRELYTIEYDYFFDSIDGTNREYDLMSEPYNRIKYGTSEVSPVNIHINKTENDEFGYIPYYALPADPDLVVKDAYVESNGGKESMYSFYFRSDAEYLSGAQLDEASELWYEYYNFVYEHYLQYPGGMTQLNDLCENIDASSIETVEAGIDNYFQDNLTYSVAPGKCPNDKEFVEYFLFENGKGFCVHFATAATLMYRKCGYPARYAEGYYIPKSAFKKQENGNYTAVVEDRMAHAWCEIYNEELGWQVKEHTKGYDGSLSANNSNPENTTTANTNNQEELTTENREDATTASNEENATTLSSGNEEKTSSAGNSGIGIGKGKGKSAGEVIESNLAIIVILAFVLIIEIQRRVRYKLKILSFNRIKDNIGVANIYDAIWQIGKFHGIRKKDKSDRDLLVDMMNTFGQLTNEEWEWIYNLAEMSAFSDKMTYSEDREKMIELYKKFRRKVLADMHILKKVCFLYILAM